MVVTILDFLFDCFNAGHSKLQWKESYLWERHIVILSLFDLMLVFVAFGWLYFSLLVFLCNHSFPPS